MSDPLRLVLATGNPGKAREFGRLLGPRLWVESMPTSVALPAETGDTFSSNARLKAESVAAALGGSVAVLADDSGLEVAALGGRPGVRSARYAGENATDEENVSKLMRELGEQQESDCALRLLALPVAAGVSGRTSRNEGHRSRGRARGPDHSLSPRGSDGFGYDPVFLPAGRDLTLAEAEPADKDSLSHRGEACRALLGRLLALELLAEEG